MPSLNLQLAIEHAKKSFNQGGPRTIRQSDANSLSFEALVSSMLGAVQHSFNLYRLTAGLRDIVISGPVASGGRLEGPALDGSIRSAPGVATWSGQNALLRDAVAKGMEQQWRILAGSVRVPGLPWYPSFAAFPGPQAPPMPNIPSPFMALTFNASAVSAASLKNAMRANLPGQVSLADELLAAIAAGIEAALQVWMSLQMLTNVLGKGPVPTFAPPYVPVGPVVMGDNIAGPHLLN